VARHFDINRKVFRDLWQLDRQFASGIGFDSRAVFIRPDELADLYLIRFGSRRVTEANFSVRHGLAVRPEELQLKYAWLCRFCRLVYWLSGDAGKTRSQPHQNCDATRFGNP